MVLGSTPVAVTDNEHVLDLCKSIYETKCNINRLWNYMELKQKEAITNGFIYSNFKECTLVERFCSCKFADKILQIQKRIYNINRQWEWQQSCSWSSNKPTINVKRMRILATEIFKTISNPSFMIDIFAPQVDSSVKSNELTIQPPKKINVFRS